LRHTVYSTDSQISHDIQTARWHE